MGEEKKQFSDEPPRKNGSPILPTVNPLSDKSEPPRSSLHPAVYIAVWIGLSSSVILFNKWVLDKREFKFPAFLTTWHLFFATIMTQLMARFTKTLDSRKNVPMTGAVYVRAIVPIGVFFSLSLICSNIAYIYLSVSFIQMLKATTPVVVLITTWVMGISPPSVKTFANVSVIVVGIVIASIGEIKFVLFGVLIQLAGITFEAIRLAMVQGLLSGSEFKMDPLVSLYYFAPACATMNFVVFLFLELPQITMEDIARVGVFTLIANASVAFALNVSVVMLIGKTSAVVLTLSGVLKDILLVMASMVIFGDPVTPLQMFGYSIALGGLMYYRLGAEKIKDYTRQAGHSWAEYGQSHPIMRQIVIFAAFVLSGFMLISMMTSTYTVDVSEIPEPLINQAAT